MNLLFKQDPNKIFGYTDNGVPFYYGNLQQYISQLCQKLEPFQSKRIGLIFPNGLEFGITLLGICHLGIAIPFNSKNSYSEYINYFSLAKIDILIIWKEYEMNPAILAANELRVPVKFLDPKEFFKNESIYSPNLEIDNLDRTCIILMTTGSTGISKLVPLTLKNLLTSAYQVASSLNLDEEDTCLCMWEQFHVGGIVDLLLAPIVSGGKILFGGSYKREKFLKLIQSFPITWTQVVPTTLLDLNRKEEGNKNLSHQLKFIRCVAAALPLVWEEDFIKKYKIPVVKTYGMTEASPLITSTSLDSKKNKPGSVGKSCGTQIKIFKINSHSAIGEVGLKGENIFKGYENQPPGFHFKNGWFMTGDLGYLDDEGFLFLTGRSKEIINKGGEKITPFEVESVLLNHPQIKDVAVSGYAHPTLGESVGALIVGDILEEDIYNFCAQHLAPFKIPSKIKYLPKIPLNTLGKKDLTRIQKILETIENKKPNPKIIGNEIEKIILELWRIELDQPNITLENDFINAGGDSLSFTRILTELENILSIKIPGKFLEKNWTVIELAKEIKPLISTNRSKEIVWIGKNEMRHKFLAQIAEEFKGFNILQDNYLAQQKNYFNFEKARHLCESLLTGYEINNLAKRTLEQQPLWKYRIRKKAKSLINNNIQMEYWYRTKVTPFAWWYNNKYHSTSTLVIGFSSIAMRLGTPTKNILNSLQPLGFDLLLLLDPNRSFFEKGIPELGDDFFDITNWLINFSSAKQYNHIIVMGTSAGGLSSIIVGTMMNCSHIVAIGCDKPSYHPGIKELLTLASYNHNQNNTQKLYLIYSKHIKRDSEAIIELQEIFQNTTLISNSSVKHHAYLHELHKKGILDIFIKEIFENA